MRFSYVGVFLLGGVAMRTSAFRATLSPQVLLSESSYYVRISDAAKAAMPGSRSIAKRHHLYYLMLAQEGRRFGLVLYRSSRHRV